MKEKILKTGTFLIPKGEFIIRPSSSKRLDKMLNNEIHLGDAMRDIKGGESIENDEMLRLKGVERD